MKKERKSIILDAQLNGNPYSPTSPNASGRAGRAAIATNLEKENPNLVVKVAGCGDNNRYIEVPITVEAARARAAAEQYKG